MSLPRYLSTGGYISLDACPSRASKVSYLTLEPSKLEDAFNNSDLSMDVTVFLTLECGSELPVHVPR